MRVNELIQWLFDHADMNDTVFVNTAVAKSAINGTGYVSITEHLIEYKPETMTINGQVYERVYR